MKFHFAESGRLASVAASAAFICVTLGVALPSSLAEVSLPAIFGHHMVVQRDIPIRIWGKADAGEKVAVELAGHSASAVADPEGRWELKIDALPAGGPHKMSIKGNNTITLKDVLVGEVWICSGQSNMQFAVSQSYDGDLDILAAKYPKIRLISVPQVGTQEPQDDFKGEWARCTPETVGSFSAVGFYFGRQLNETLNVPIGLIDNAWGGSSAEAWVRRDLLEQNDRYAKLMAGWKTQEDNYHPEKIAADYQARLTKWQDAVAVAKEAGKKWPPRPRAPRNNMTGNHRPANIYNGVLKPTIGYGIRGAIWYQGESNASRAYEYRELFPLMIKSWRDEWSQGEFPFYFVQLADFQTESDEPQESSWAELREAQTLTMAKLPNTGQAVIIDVGEGRDIHPRDKLTVGKRLARWALANDYGIKVPFRSPQYKSMEVKEGKVVLTFDYTDRGLFTFDVNEGVGFAVAGEDKKFVWAKAKVVGANQIEVSSDAVPNPVAVRYAWAQNPVCNVYDKNGLPLTPFRTDDWPGVTIDN